MFVGFLEAEYAKYRLGYKMINAFLYSCETVAFANWKIIIYPDLGHAYINA